MATNPLNILLTNDDGYNAPGIQTLYTALKTAGFNVHIVAPAVNQSAQGSSLGGDTAVASPVAITEFSPGNYYVDGRPAVATLAGVDDLFGGNPPDLVISGTNRGDNIGESENISGTVNGALQGLFEGVPSIAISAGSFNGSYDAAFANSANFMVDFLHQLADQPAGQPLLPGGESLTINVPGNPALGGIAVTTVTPESSASFPYMPTGANTYAEGFVPNTTPSGSTTSEGSQFLTNHITISPIDGNWGGTGADRDAIAVRLGATLNTNITPAKSLEVLLVNEDGHASPGLNAARDALLAKGYDVTILAPTTDQSAVGSALFLSPVTVTQYSAKDYSSTGTPASLVSLALDPNGLFHGVQPDLVVSGADKGDAVGIENANHSATVGAAVTALFNYGVPSIALNVSSGSTADIHTGADFLANLVANLQATQGSATGILPSGVGLSINVPVGATEGNFAFTTIDKATDHNLYATGDASHAMLGYDGPIVSGAPHSEGDAFNAGQITVSPIDGSFASHDPAAYAALASLVGTTYGTPTAAPHTLAFTVSEDAFQGDAQFTVSVDGHQIGGAQTVTASHAAGQSQTITLLDYFDSDIHAISLNYINDAGGATPAADRNLYVDKLTFDGVVFQGENAINTAGHTVGDSAGLFTNGSLEFFPGATTLSNPGYVQGTSGADTVAINAANVKYAAGAGDDTVFIGSQGASVNGGMGNDTIVGGAGKDTITGGAGADMVTGGGGADTFIFNKGDFADPASNGGKYDVIGDFQGAGDGFASGAGDFIRLQGFSSATTIAHTGDVSGHPEQHIYQITDGAYHAQLLIQYANNVGTDLKVGDYGVYA